MWEQFAVRNDNASCLHTVERLLQFVFLQNLNICYLDYFVSKIIL